MEVRFYEKWPNAMHCCSCGIWLTMNSTIGLLTDAVLRMVFSHPQNEVVAVGPLQNARIHIDRTACAYSRDAYRSRHILRCRVARAAYGSPDPDTAVRSGSRAHIPDIASKSEGVARGEAPICVCFLRKLLLVDARLDWENAYPLNRSSVIRHAPEASGVYGLQNARHWVYIGQCPNIRVALLKYLSGQMPYVLQSQSSVFVFELCRPRKRMERQHELVQRFQPVLQQDQEVWEVISYRADCDNASAS
jgi:hypothetical protein